MITKSITSVRGEILSVQVRRGDTGRIVEYAAIGTFHPSYLLRNSSPVEGDPKHQAFKDMEKALKYANRFIEERDKKAEELGVEL